MLELDAIKYAVSQRCYGYGEKDGTNLSESVAESPRAGDNQFIINHKVARCLCSRRNSVMIGASQPGEERRGLRFYVL